MKSASSEPSEEKKSTKKRSHKKAAKGVEGDDRGKT